jgi:hypothetical protein
MLLLVFGLKLFTVRCCNVSAKQLTLELRHRLQTQTNKRLGQTLILNKATVTFFHNSHLSNRVG